MKKMKTKIATALVLGAISFGMFSFTTTPINAQSTNSETSFSETTFGTNAWQYMTLEGSNMQHILTAGVNYIIFGGRDEVVQYPNDIID